jgi:hypothetical protein
LDVKKMSFVETNDWLGVLSRMLDSSLVIAQWFLEQIKQKQNELGSETVNLAAAAIIVAREMGFDVQSWEI